MRRVLAALVAGSLAVTVTGCSVAGTGRPAPARHHAVPASYYLALGDSLSRGVQPDSAGVSVATRDGYADQLDLALRRSHPGLRLLKLGCPGETTATMIKGGICPYQRGSQLAAAASFLRAHRAQVRLVTIDIGANDLAACMTHPSAVRLAICVARSIPQVATNLDTILRRLHQAAPGARIIGMNYYLPALAAWRDGLAGRVLARASELAAAGYNTMLSRVYQSSGARVADVFAAFHTSDFAAGATNGPGELPRNVAAICQWTWECAAPPRGPNLHANEAGYAVIARAFLAADGR